MGSVWGPNAIFALVALRHLHLIDVLSSLDAINLPRRGVSWVHMQEVAVPENLLVVELCQEFYVRARLDDALRIFSGSLALARFTLCHVENSVHIGAPMSRIGFVCLMRSRALSRFERKEKSHG